MWPTIVDRARHSVQRLPDDAVLGGFSMGAGVLGVLWPERLGAAGVFCLHAPTTVPDAVPAGTPVQLHVAAPDRFAPPASVADFRASAATAGADASIHRYPGAGHFYTDDSLPDHHAPAAAET